jgi:hypothetical protein
MVLSRDPAYIVQTIVVVVLRATQRTQVYHLSAAVAAATDYRMRVFAVSGLALQWIKASDIKFQEAK